MSRLFALAGLVALLAGCSVGGGDDRSASYAVDGCTRGGLEGHSVARVWDEAILAAVRRDVPAPTVHARNLFHVSAAMWDAWARRPGRGRLPREEKHDADADVQARREAAMSYAAYRLLLHRYSYAAGLEQTFGELVGTMRRLCYRIDAVGTEGDSPAALGNRIAAAYIARGRSDGALEAARYADEEYKPVNAPLVVADDEIAMGDPSKWQPLALDQIVAQNGVPIPGKVQRFVGSQWGHVRSFALPRGRDGLPADPGRRRCTASPPRPGRTRHRSAQQRARAADPRRSTSAPAPAAPGARHERRPRSRGQPGHREALRVQPRHPWRVRPCADRVLGRRARVGTTAGPLEHGRERRLRLAGLEHVVGGRRVDRLEWDVKLLFALNGAVHDAAVAAWGAKRHYDTARPISMIRYLAARHELRSSPG